MSITNGNSVQCISMCFLITLIYSFKKFVLLCRFLHKLEEISFSKRCIVTDQSKNNKEFTDGRYQRRFYRSLVYLRGV